VTRAPLDPSGEQMAELIKLGDQAMALCQEAASLAEKVVAVIDQRAPQPPGRRKRHLRVVAGCRKRLLEPLSGVPRRRDYRTLVA
jgi:hypothetical protein